MRKLWNKTLTKPGSEVESQVKENKEFSVFSSCSLTEDGRLVVIIDCNLQFLKGNICQGGKRALPLILKCLKCLLPSAFVLSILSAEPIGCLSCSLDPNQPSKDNVHWLGDK